MSHSPFVVEKARYRAQRLSHLLREEVTNILLYGLSDPRIGKLGSIQVTDLKISVDYKNATFYFLVDRHEPGAVAGAALSKSEIAKAEAALNDAAGYIRHQIADRLATKAVPMLHFQFDTAVLHARKISSLLNEATAPSGSSEVVTQSQNL